MKAKEKPAYQSPKVLSLDYKESAIGSVEPVLCEMGSNATGPCSTTGNNPGDWCQEGIGFEV